MQRLSREGSGNLEEFKSLVEAAGYSVAGCMRQIRRADPRFQIGKGKVKELVHLVKKLNVEKVIFDSRLKSVQAYNLAKETGVETIDRFQLILEIFDRRASTSEAKLQIQLAKLRYELAHAKEKVRLARMEEQPGFMGLGSYEVDIYHETVQRQIHTIQEKLRRIRKRRRLHRKRRQQLGFSTISLAGYTCAGKSTLFNTLVKEAVPTGEGLFTTLSTSSRTIDLLGKRAILTDTVGFIDRLPVTLIEAFRSTLEETIFSDLILLIIDANEPVQDIKRKISVCFDIIHEIGIQGIPVVTALNKIDLLSKQTVEQLLEQLKDAAPKIVPISARNVVNIDLLKQAMSERLENYISVEISIPITDESLSFLSWLFRFVNVKKVKYDNDVAYVVFEATPQFAEKALGRARQHNGLVKKR